MEEALAARWEREEGWGARGSTGGRNALGSIKGSAPLGGYIAGTVVVRVFRDIANRSDQCRRRPGCGERDVQTGSQTGKMFLARHFSKETSVYGIRHERLLEYALASNTPVDIVVGLGALPVSHAFSLSLCLFISISFFSFSPALSRGHLPRLVTYRHPFPGALVYFVD